MDRGNTNGNADTFIKGLFSKDIAREMEKSGLKIECSLLEDSNKKKQKVNAKWNMEMETFLKDFMKGQRGRAREFWNLKRSIQS